MNDQSPYSPPASKVADRDVDSRPAKPRQIEWAVKLLWFDLAIAVLILGLQYSRGEYSGGSPGASAIAVGFLAALFAISVWVILAIDRGRNWGRVVQLLFVVLAAIFLFMPSDEPNRATVVEYLLELVSLAIEVVAIILVFTRPGALWFRR
jgi:hypothetical protein